MESRRFDNLAKVMGDPASRRATVRAALGALAALSGGAGVAQAARRRGVTAEACIPTGKKCPAPKPRGKSGKKLGCSKCCQRHTDQVGGKTKCACRPDGFASPQAAYCCSGVAQGGVCVPRDAAPPPDPVCPPEVAAYCCQCAQGRCTTDLPGEGFEVSQQGCDIECDANPGVSDFQLAGSGEGFTCNGETCTLVTC